GDGGAEGLGDLGDAMAQDIREADQDGDVVVLVAEFIDEELEVDGLVRSLVRVDGDVPEPVDPEAAFAPVPDAVAFDGVGELPVPNDCGIGTGSLESFAHQSCLGPFGAAGRPLPAATVGGSTMGTSYIGRTALQRVRGGGAEFLHGIDMTSRRASHPRLEAV